MKFFKIILMLQLLNLQLLASGAYLWQHYKKNESSCCLFLNGTDICNPNSVCTRNVALDLQGIFDYIGRILQVDKGSTFSYYKILNQAQEFIKNILASSTRLFYRFDTPQRHVKFFHEVAETARMTEKNNKNPNAATTAGIEKQKNEDIVLAYLEKLGLAWKLK